MKRESRVLVDGDVKLLMSGGQTGGGRRRAAGKRGPASWLAGFAGRIFGEDFLGVFFLGC